MDLICLILCVIDCFKPSVTLSVFVIITGFIDIVLLIKRNREFNISYIVSMTGIVISVYHICTL
jgi:hypothetical protein